MNDETAIFILHSARPNLMNYSFILALSLSGIVGILSLDILSQIANAQEPEFQTIPVTQDTNRFYVQAAITNGGEVTGIQVNPDYGTILISVETSAEEDSELTIILPRELIDAKDNMTDAKFDVIVEGELTDYTEQSGASSERKLVIPLPSETTQVEISGTQIVPEFPLAFLVITISFAVTIGTLSLLRNRRLF